MNTALRLCASFFSLFLLASTLPLMAHAVLIDKSAALVNAEVITLSDVNTFRKLRQLRQEIDPFFSFFKKNPQTEEEIITYLVQEQLILQKLNPTKDEVEEEVNQIQRNNKIDRDRLKEVLKSQGVLFDDYLAMMRVSVAKRHLVDRELRPLAAVTDDEVKNYYYTAPEFNNNSKVRNLVLSYNLTQFNCPSGTVADKVRDRIRSGEDPQVVADDMKILGVDSQSLGTLSEDKLAPVVRKALQGINVGYATDALSTGSGYVVLRINQIEAPKDPVFEKEKEAIRGALFEKAISRQLDLWTDRERSQSYVYIPQ